MHVVSYYIAAPARTMEEGFKGPVFLIVEHFLYLFFSLKSIRDDEEFKKLLQLMRMRE